MGIGKKRKQNKTENLVGQFRTDEKGYALAMTLVALPLVLALSAFVIDGSRVANLHTDLQNAVDAMALAGARELDGDDDAIQRAQAAIAAMNSNQAWFGDNGTAQGMGSKVNITYTTADGASSDVTVSFLGAIPASDDTAIGSGACAATSSNGTDCQVLGASDATRSNNALYVRVVATPRSIRTIFQFPGIGNDTVSITAEAVATYSAVVCDITPIFICNPFEDYQGNSLANGSTFAQNFGQGNLYGRQLNLSYGKNGQAGPGNFGFLRVDGNGASALAQALATSSPSCYRKSGLDTKPGANVGPVTDGINTRFGFYPNGSKFPSSNQAYAPDVNVRVGQSQGTSNGNGKGNGKGNGGGNGGGNSGPSCTGYDPEDNSSSYESLAFPEGDTEIDMGGGTISGSSDWDIETYWDIAHGGYASAPDTSGYSAPALPVSIPQSFPNLPNGTNASRYDVYNYEIDNNLVGDASPNGETGVAQCQAPSVTSEADRRIIFSAIVNCKEYEDDLKGAATNIPAEGFARMFLTRPAIAQGNDRTIAMEIVDITGTYGLGTLSDFFREEAALVR
ncbi:Tad domain-containing protein [Pararhizobium sp. IMCC21322]|uniref:Tad domain-containing protein n=1 Tax=Pararhizobium sp. IMCC21322 TaxID=3067903 RepID=UPI002741AFDA|nr:Tad domain-containing protein [Pararhizobium sp. IMCC21322]